MKKYIIIVAGGKGLRMGTDLQPTETGVWGNRLRQLVKTFKHRFF